RLTVRRRLRNRVECLLLERREFEQGVAGRRAGDVLADRAVAAAADRRRAAGYERPAAGARLELRAAERTCLRRDVVVEPILDGGGCLAHGIDHPAPSARVQRAGRGQIPGRNQSWPASSTL